MGHTRGRPRAVARLRSIDSYRLDLVTRFYGYIDELSYSERKALARALYSTESRIKGFRYHRRWPGDLVALQVVDWCERGRPVRYDRIAQSYVDL